MNKLLKLALNGGVVGLSLAVFSAQASTVRLHAEYEKLLPPEPSFPTKVCSELKANLKYVNWVLPDEIDHDPKNSSPDSERLQQALDNCPKGQAVKLVKHNGNNGFLTGPIEIPSGVSLWIEKEVKLFASRSPADYDLGDGVCGDALPKIKNRCKPWIYASKTENSGIYGEGTIDARGGAILTSGKRAYQTTWWDLSMQSKAKPKLEQNNPRMLQIDDAKNFTFYKVGLQNGGKFHVAAKRADGLIFWGIKLLTPSLAYTVPGYKCAEEDMPRPGKLDKPSTCFIPELVKNTDGIDPGASKNVTVAYSYISTGDDNVAIKSGKETDRPATENHLYAHNQFYYGHGMSIGSETDAGVNNIKIWDLTLDGMDSGHGVGIRIKSDGKRGGDITNVTYDNVCMRRAKDSMVFTPYYSSTKKDNLPPKMENIVVRNFRYVDYPDAKYNKSLVNVSGYQSKHLINPLKLTLDNVVYDTQPKIRDNKHYSHHHIEYTFGPNPVVNFPVREQADIKVFDKQTKQAKPIDCPDSRFEPYPAPDSPF